LSRRFPLQPADKATRSAIRNWANLIKTESQMKAAIEKLSPREKSTLTAWLESQEEPVMSEAEEAALLDRLDQAARELDAGRGVPLDQVRGMVGKWAAR
jgi:hypothetical protein